MFFTEYFKNFDFENISGLTDELKGVYINNYFNKKKTPILLVCNSLYEANKLFSILKNYLENVLFFPMDDFMTSEVLAVSPDLKMTRIETLYKLVRDCNQIVVTNLMGYLRFLPSKELFLSKYIKLDKKNPIKIENLVKKLYEIGYSKESIVNKSGEMALRGFVVDIFPINNVNPIRIEFWGDEIESIRYFDVNNQRTIEEIDESVIIPNTEFLTNKEKEREYLQRELINFEKVVNIIDYLPNCKIFYNNKDELQIGYEYLINDIYEYSLSASIPSETKFVHDLSSFKSDVNFYQNDIISLDNAISFESYNILEKFVKLEDIKKILEKYLKNYKKIIICVSNRYQANKIIENIADNVVFTNAFEIYENKINVIVLNINEGYIFNNTVVISEAEIFNKRDYHSQYKTNFRYGTKIKDISKLEIGDYVVHDINGIGKYCGIKKINKNGLEKDYIQLEYAGGDKLYIPVEKIETISKYGSKEGNIPKLNKLGSSEWQKIKIRARNRAKDMADQLLNLYALRETKKGFAFEKDDENQIRFEKEFPYQETADQLKAIEEIKRDMESDIPMDRLLCGDVGYGKTEVAFRAAFKAIMSGKQVVLLCPTTILSNQHYQNAIERFKSYPINIKLLNRFISTKEINKTISELKTGVVDFVIGTHKLLNDKIEYKNLGLLIVDEEQRFGVTHKEKIKQFKNNVDVLTLSATPIPRTLQMSLSGMRGLSTIETPPSNRYPVQTYVISYNEKIIKDAIYKELSRKGQVFILYNHIESIEKKAIEIQNLAKDAKVIYAHGKMDKNTIEDVMMKFINKEYDILVCTTIIETGIDIPNVNTLIVMDADKFGLSQLYQLRGRVGRTNKIAYCYLMYEQSKILTENAQKRLSAIKEFTELGNGLSIAMRDLSIRGAGDILGKEQAGFIDSVGIELFMHMLKQEIDKLKGVYVDMEERNMPLIDVDTSVSDNYVVDNDLKIEIHKKINEIDSYEKLKQVESELNDRFGKLDEKMIIYMYEEWFEHLANKLKINKIKQTKNYIEIFLDKSITSRIDGEKLFLEVVSLSRNFKFSMFADSLIINFNILNLEKHFIYYLIDLLFIIEKAIIK